MNTNGLSPLEIAWVAVENAREEYNTQQYYCREVCTAIEAVQDFCEDSDHKRAILAELRDYQDSAEKSLDAAECKMTVAEQMYSDLRLYTQATQA